MSGNNGDSIRQHTTVMTDEGGPSEMRFRGAVRILRKEAQKSVALAAFYKTIHGKSWPSYWRFCSELGISFAARSVTKIQTMHKWMATSCVECANQ